MALSYRLVSSNDSSPDDAFTSPPTKPRRNYWAMFLGSISLANVCLLIVTLHFWRAAGHTGGAAATIPPSTTTSTNTLPTHDLDIPGSLASVDVLPIAYVPFHWNTPWGAPNASDADPLWDNINTAHGHIAVDHTWAAENNWPRSMDIPFKPGKGMYLLQAYHQLHCLRIVRSMLVSLSRKTPSPYPLHHALHCFDALRQHIMCHADNTPLYGKGDGMAGDGQMHRCRDWTALRDYATQNTACFRDGKPGMSFEDRFGVCDDGTDGLEELTSNVDS